jgi:hypothetical protein
VLLVVPVDEVDAVVLVLLVVPVEDVELVVPVEAVEEVVLVLLVVPVEEVVLVVPVLPLVPVDDVELVVPVLLVVPDVLLVEPVEEVPSLSSSFSHALIARIRSPLASVNFKKLFFFIFYICLRVNTGCSLLIFCAIKVDGF